jgi:hypothetical protein
MSTENSKLQNSLKLEFAIEVAEKAENDKKKSLPGENFFMAFALALL